MTKKFTFKMLSDTPEFQIVHYEHILASLKAVSPPHYIVEFFIKQRTDLAGEPWELRGVAS